MYLFNVTLTDNVSAPSAPTKWTPAVDSSHFTLSMAGVLGLVGGDEATFSTATALTHSGRRWLGWYNTPGSYWIAKEYGNDAISTFFKVLFPAIHAHPSSEHRPRFQAFYSGTVLDNSGPLALVLMRACASVKSTTLDAHRSAGQSPPASGITVSIVTLNGVAPEETVDVEQLGTWSSYSAMLPIIFSVISCIGSGVIRDWYSFASILLGMLSNGIFCAVVGSGTIRFTHHVPAAGCPPGDGILGSDKEFSVLLGEESAVNSITRGKLSLEFPRSGIFIGYCSMLLTIQFIAQLFLISQASLLGQIIFVCSLAVSWIYNYGSFAYEKESIQSKLLLDKLLKQQTPTKKYTLRTRTSAIVFALYVLLHKKQDKAENGTPPLPGPKDDGKKSLTNRIDESTSSPSATLPNFHLSPSPSSSTNDSSLSAALLSPHLSSSSSTMIDHDTRDVLTRKILDAYLPDTDVWKMWKEKVVEGLTKGGELRIGEADLGDSQLKEKDRTLLQWLHSYAQEAYECYKEIVGRGDLDYSRTG